MREYLIRAADGLGWIPVRREHLTAVLVPPGREARPIEGSGELCFELSGMQFAFSGEDVGWQEVVDGEVNVEMADAVVAEVTNQVMLESGQVTSWILLTE